MAKSVSKTYFITTESTMVAESLLDFLETKGFSVYDEDIVGKGVLLAFNTTHNKLKRAISEAKDSGLLVGPYSIKVSEIKITERPILKEGSTFKTSFSF